jgi:hypothetical protein
MFERKFVMPARRHLVLVLAALAPLASASAAPLSQQAWPECRALKPGSSFVQASAVLGGRGRRAAFAMVDDLPVATYAFRRAARTCRVQFEEGVVLAAPTLR